MSRTIASFYVQVKAERRTWSDSKVIGSKAVKITQGKPAHVEPDAIVVKVNVSLPIEAFEQVPVADIEVPLEHISPAIATSSPIPVASGQA